MFQPSVRSDVVNLRKHLPDILVVLFVTIAQSFLPKYIDGVGKGQASVLVGGQLFAEILIPGGISSVDTHTPMVVQHLQVFPGDGQGHGDLDPLLFFH